MREFPIRRFWYGKGAQFSTMEELIEKRPGWFIWAVETFQDVTEEQAEYFYKVYKMRLPKEVICSPQLLNEINEGKPYEFSRGDDEEVYKDLCRKYADRRGEEWNEWLKEEKSPTKS